MKKGILTVKPGWAKHKRNLDAPPWPKERGATKQMIRNEQDCMVDNKEARARYRRLMGYQDLIPEDIEPGVVRIDTENEAAEYVRPPNISTDDAPGG